MKKFFNLLAMAGLVGMVGAAEIPVNGNFAKSVVGKDTPELWTKNFSWVKKIGQSKMVNEKGKFVLQVKTATMVTPFYSMVYIPAKVGDKITISAKFQGKGDIRFFYYGYNAKGQFISAKTSELFKAATPATQAKSTLTISAVKGKVLKSVVMGFEIHPNAQVAVSDIKVEK